MKTGTFYLLSPDGKRYVRFNVCKHGRQGSHRGAWFVKRSQQVERMLFVFGKFKYPWGLAGSAWKWRNFWCSSLEDGRKAYQELTSRYGYRPATEQEIQAREKQALEEPGEAKLPPEHKIG